MYNLCNLRNFFYESSESFLQRLFPEKEKSFLFHFILSFFRTNYEEYLRSAKKDSPLIGRESNNIGQYRSRDIRVGAREQQQREET